MGTDGRDAGRGVSATHNAPLRSSARRKLSRQGNSLMVGVPPEFLRNLNLYPGDELELIFDREWGGFFVRPLRARVFRSTSAPSTGFVGAPRE